MEVPRNRLSKHFNPHFDTEQQVSRILNHTALHRLGRAPGTCRGAVMTSAEKHDAKLWVS